MPSSSTTMFLKKPTKTDVLLSGPTAPPNPIPGFALPGDEPAVAEEVWQARDFIAAFVEAEFSESAQHFRVTCDIALADLRALGNLDLAAGTAQCGKLLRAAVIHDAGASALWRKLASDARGPDILEVLVADRQARAEEQAAAWLRRHEEMTRGTAAVPSPPLERKSWWRRGSESSESAASSSSIMSAQGLEPRHSLEDSRGSERKLSIRIWVSNVMRSRRRWDSSSSGGETELRSLASREGY